MTPQANPNAAAKIVNEYQRRPIIPDPDAARRYVAADLPIRFTAWAGRIAQMNAWNDSAEWLIDRRGPRCADYRAAR